MLFQNRDLILAFLNYFINTLNESILDPPFNLTFELSWQNVIPLVFKYFAKHVNTSVWNWLKCVSFIKTQWDTINRKQITRWQHVSRLKASSFGPW
jgi:hypothetical protein